jgi:AmmeMemoRadiSam system protein A
MNLYLEDKRELLKLARATLIHKLVRQKDLVYSPKPAKFFEKRGGFVTLHKQERLRGCIGYMEAIEPLYLMIQKMVVKAALDDPRFQPVTPGEVPDLEIEISVLSPITKVDHIEEIEVGKHGLIIRQGLRSGVLLPQVATEWGWDRETFLRETSAKAGLHKESWREADIFYFSADVFNEKECLLN